eukprot:TRINITY_DN1799_c0_g1_i4.p2 TRINITY_DN1799_c0_g1~~TRINITY_DN1799_c0_g1_i4.p2  ORF type:complete len:107 (+),score=3.69 TRINITY_DN1799_c0_g1_i4:283-603(+)
MMYGVMTTMHLCIMNDSTTALVSLYNRLTLQDIMSPLTNPNSRPANILRSAEPGRLSVYFNTIMLVKSNNMRGPCFSWIDVKCLFNIDSFSGEFGNISASASPDKP